MPLHVLPPVLRGVFTSILLVLTTSTLTLLMMPLALAKLLLPFTAVRRVCDRALTALAAAWVAANNAWIRGVRPRRVPDWDVQGVDGLDPRGWYLVSGNHQSWVDIVILQRIFHGRVPFLKFFLKQELIWVPVIGVAWWALDFPFMKRGKGSGARGSDLATTRAACEKFKRIPTSVINFVEGTRFTPVKHDEQRSPYKHLLKPKIGGLGVALATMGEQFTALLDVTIVYADRPPPTFWDLMCGRVGAVTVRVQALPIPADLLSGDPLLDKAYRRRLTHWVEAQWRDKDALIDRLLAR